MGQILVIDQMAVADDADDGACHACPLMIFTNDSGTSLS
jgi:hypothetical protein